METPNSGRGSEPSTSEHAGEPTLAASAEAGSTAPAPVAPAPALGGAPTSLPASMATSPPPPPVTAAAVSMQPPGVLGITGAFAQPNPSVGAANAVPPPTAQAPVYANGNIANGAHRSGPSDRAKIASAMAGLSNWSPSNSTSPAARHAPVVASIVPSAPPSAFGTGLGTSWSAVQASPAGDAAAAGGHLLQGGTGAGGAATPLLHPPATFPIPPPPSQLSAVPQGGGPASAAAVSAAAASGATFPLVPKPQANGGAPNGAVPPPPPFTAGGAEAGAPQPPHAVPQPTPQHYVMIGSSAAPAAAGPEGGAEAPVMVPMAYQPGAPGQPQPAVIFVQQVPGAGGTGAPGHDPSPGGVQMGMAPMQAVMLAPGAQFNRAGGMTGGMIIHGGIEAMQTYYMPQAAQRSPVDPSAGGAPGAPGFDGSEGADGGGVTATTYMGQEGGLMVGGGGAQLMYVPQQLGGGGMQPQLVMAAYPHGAHLHAAPGIVPGGAGEHGKKPGRGADAQPYFVRGSPTNEWRALVRPLNALDYLFTQDRDHYAAVAKRVNRCTDDEILQFLSRLGLRPGHPPLPPWDGLRDRGKYQVLADIFSWSLTACHAATRKAGLKKYQIIVTEEQAQMCVPYHPGRPYKADRAMLSELGLTLETWKFRPQQIQSDSVASGLALLTEAADADGEAAGGEGARRAVGGKLAAMGAMGGGGAAPGMGTAPGALSKDERVPPSIMATKGGMLSAGGLSGAGLPTSSGGAGPAPLAAAAVGGLGVAATGPGGVAGGAAAVVPGSSRAPGAVGVGAGEHDADGTPGEVMVTCNGATGVYLVEHGRFVMDGSVHLLSGSAFELQAGKKSKKWKESVRLVRPDGSVGEAIGPWLAERGLGAGPDIHEVGSGDESAIWGGGGGDGSASSLAGGGSATAAAVGLMAAEGVLGAHRAASKRDRGDGDGAGGGGGEGGAGPSSDGPDGADGGGGGGGGLFMFGGLLSGGGGGGGAKGYRSKPSGMRGGPGAGGGSAEGGGGKGGMPRPTKAPRTQSYRAERQYSSADNDAAETLAALMGFASPEDAAAAADGAGGAGGAGGGGGGGVVGVDGEAVSRGKRTSRSALKSARERMQQQQQQQHQLLVPRAPGGGGGAGGGVPSSSSAPAAAAAAAGGGAAGGAEERSSSSGPPSLPGAPAPAGGLVPSSPPPGGGALSSAGAAPLAGAAGAGASSAGRVAAGGGSPTAPGALPPPSAADGGDILSVKREADMMEAQLARLKRQRFKHGTGGARGAGGSPRVVGGGGGSLPGDQGEVDAEMAEVEEMQRAAEAAAEEAAKLALKAEMARKNAAELALLRAQQGSSRA